MVGLWVSLKNLRAGERPALSKERNMGNLSQFQEEESLTVKAIYDYWKKKGDSEPTRGYLGASIIGHECDRFLWFTFRGCVTKNFDGRMYRLFERGKREENVFISELQGIGCEVHATDESGNQFEVTACGGHFKAHMDGCAFGIPEAPKTWHVLEFKTFGGTEDESKDFGKVKESGVKVAKPLHYAQMMVEMGLTKMERALYLAAKKATDELYAERVRYVASEHKAIISRAERIIKRTQPCERMTTRSDDYRCKFCDAKDLCWGMGAVALPIPALTCKTCCHASPEMDGDGRWSCAKGHPMSESFLPCSQHLVLPGLLTFCEPTDSGDGWIQFTNKDGTVWRHGNETGMWSTAELMKTPAKMVGDRGIEAIKSQFGGKIEAFMFDPIPLVDQYPHEDTRLVWHGQFDSEKIANILSDVMGVADVGAPTRQEETEKHQAYEFGGKFLLVHYKADHYAAIWRGVE